MTIEHSLKREYWVEAELSECRESRGHCYMELIQKDQLSSTPVARAQAKCWRAQWQMLQPYFERTTGQTFHAGLKVRLKVYAQFHEAYGFSWIVTDIDPTFTMGDMARRRQEIIRQLRQEGVFDLQKELQLPLFCLRIAVISSATAAGYGDFEHQLADSPFAFETRLFPAIMQGEQVEQSIIAALNSIYGDDKPYDCIVIIRGGGATADLSGFDTLALAENVAQFPLPIITGIGHDRDESILDMVSHTRVKTPTAAAALLITHAQQVLDAINDAQARIAHYCGSRLTALKAQLSTLEAALPRIFCAVKTRHEARIESLYHQLSHLAQQKVTSRRSSITQLEERIPLLIGRQLLAEKHRLQLIEEKVKSLDPTLLLRRGYSITLKDGHALRNAAVLRPGDEIETRLEKGTIKSTVI
jgi:exodeoxyribonuclease VII large subunit